MSNKMFTEEVTPGEELFYLTVLFALATALSIPIHGYVLSKLWLWFVMPITHLQQLTILQAYGVASFLSYATYPGKPKSNDKEIVLPMIFALVVRPSVCLLVAYLVHKAI